MHAGSMLHKWLKEVMPEIHKARQETVSTVVFAALSGGRLTVTGLGRAIKGQAKEKHNIKMADRLLSNINLQGEKHQIYTALTAQIVKNTPRPIIIIDWTGVDEGQKFSVIRASTPVNGRALTLYEETHDVTTKEKRATHKEFLRNLKLVLPKECSPIIVTDAGFRVPWFKQILRMGWDYVGRVRNRNKIKVDYKWILAKGLYASASAVPRNLGTFCLTQSNNFVCNLVLFKAKPKKRTNRNKLGVKARSGKSLRHSKREREPWLLATSLSNFTAKRIVQIYASRMQIEESFRDIKSSRYGLSLENSGTYKKERLAILFLLGAIANTFAWLLGKMAEINGSKKHFQANTTTHKNVLSTVFLGIQVLRKGVDFFNQKLFSLAKKYLNLVVDQYAY